MAAQNISNGLIGNGVTQIGQRSLYSPVAPIPVLSGHANHQLLDLILHAWTSRATPSAAIIFPGDQLAVPSQERLRRDDGRQFMKHAPAQFLSLEG